MNRTGYYSLVLQGIVDRRDLFMNTSIGQERFMIPQCSRDWDVLEGRRREFIPRNYMVLYGGSVLTVILGDPHIFTLNMAQEAVP